VAAVEGIIGLPARNKIIEVFPVVTQRQQLARRPPWRNFAVAFKWDSHSWLSASTASKKQSKHKIAKRRLP
jgi:hypothetical protein